MRHERFDWYFRFENWIFIFVTGCGLRESRVPVLYPSGDIANASDWNLIAFVSPRRQEDSKKSLHRALAMLMSKYAFLHFSALHHIVSRRDVRLQRRSWRRYFHNGDMCVVVPLRFAIAIMFGSIDRSIASQLAIINYFVVWMRAVSTETHKICVTKNHWHVDLLFPVVTSIAFFLFASKCNRFPPFVSARCCNGKCRPSSTSSSNIIKIITSIIVREIEITGLFSFDKTKSVENKFQYSNENFVVAARNRTAMAIRFRLLLWSSSSFS